MIRVFVLDDHEVVRTGLRELDWRTVLLFGVLAGILMSFAFLQGATLSLLAGIVPVGTGLLLGRRVTKHYGLHGFMTGLVGGVAGSVSLAALIFLTPLRTAMQAALGPQAIICYHGGVVDADAGAQLRRVAQELAQ